MMLIPASFYVEPKQEARIRNALKSRKGCQIRVRKSSNGPHKLLVRPQHRRRYEKAVKGEVVSLPFKHEELMENMHHKGGFLPLIAAALAPIIGGIAGGLIEKEIAGSGIRDYRKKAWWQGSGVGTKGPKLYTIESQGSGLYLNPWKGSGLYLNPWKGR